MEELLCENAKERRGYLEDVRVAPGKQDEFASFGVPSP